MYGHIAFFRDGEGRCGRYCLLLGDGSVFYIEDFKLFRCFFLTIYRLDYIVKIV